MLVLAYEENAYCYIENKYSVNYCFAGKQKKKVMAVRAKEDRAGKVDYSKTHACIFCGQLDPKIARHLCSKKT